MKNKLQQLKYDLGLSNDDNYRNHLILHRAGYGQAIRS